MGRYGLLLTATPPPGAFIAPNTALTDCRPGTRADDSHTDTVSYDCRRLIAGCSQVDLKLVTG